MIPLYVDASLAKQISEDSFRASIDSDATALDRRNLSALGQIAARA